ncbi:MAG TPA: arginine--tRNA ligase [Candidatus Angelobacter sp.]|nr:arginine--tRNA ligase [Candidatus Angelobacter sp.]
MYQPIEKRVRAALAAFIRAKYDVEINVVTERPPKIEMGEIASPVCFELAKRLKRAPRQIAQEIASTIGKIDGVERIEIAGGGYLNAFLDRAAFLTLTFAESRREPASVSADGPKTIVEHTAINPNKAAHIGHLRNAVIGDTFVRLLRQTRRRVEVQNYIDNTGVQVADVILGFIHREKLSLADVRALAAKNEPRFDYYCWDVYARVTQYLAEDKTRLELRGQVMKEIEAGHGPVAEMAEFVSKTILQAHLKTMDRLGIDYDLLSRESEVLGMKFWDAAFQMLRERGAIRMATSGKQAGCWIMPLNDATEGDAEAAGDAEADAKIIVRSNGTVTYVGKDIAYHLWKFGLLNKDFRYVQLSWDGGRTTWMTSMDGRNSGDGVPKFGNAQEVFNVIDSRQKYPQQVVREGLRALGFEKQAEHLVHIAYDVVGLTPRCAVELGYTVTEEDAKRPYIEMSGRKGQGVKADDLLDQMEKHALAEVDARHRDFSDVERTTVAHAIAVGALRYFLLKYTRSTIIAFDFKDALSFEGETGPYVQYAVVRARSIERKLTESQPGQGLPASADETESEMRTFLAPPEGDDLWELALLAGSLDARIEAAVNAQEPAFVAKYAFELAQAFNVFYHKHHIVSEKNEGKKSVLWGLTSLVRRQLVVALELLGIQAPEKM